MNPMVSTIVQEIMITENDTFAWRGEIIKNQIFTHQEARDLSEREISLIHHALLTQRLSKLNSDQLMEHVSKYNLQYHVHFEEEQMQIGAICY
jgi:DNA-binding transcriptional MocR family regulator